MLSADTLFDEKYSEILLSRLNVCKDYKPKLGTGKAVTLADFQRLYGTDSFYSWFGLSNPLMYAAHKAAGGITSLYRQIGTGCEALFRQILCDCLGLTEDQVKWSYQVHNALGRTRTLSLDGRIELGLLNDEIQRERISKWIADVSDYLDIDSGVVQMLKGVVFEVRQGYKSKDAKRQNADIANAAQAYTQGYLPVVVVMSTQIDTDIVVRYENEKWLILQGNISDSPIRSTYAFCQEIIGYDLAGFFERNAPQLNAAVEDILTTLWELPVEEE
jgi:hypothetical protein